MSNFKKGVAKQEYCLMFGIVVNYVAATCSSQKHEVREIID